MEEKTDQLRDIFLDVADGEAVTERQTERRGTLLSGGDGPGRIANVLERMRDRFDFSTDLDTGALCTVVERFYDGADDESVADGLGVSPETVFEARMDLHLVRDDDTALDRAAVRDCLDEGLDVAGTAAALDVTTERAARARRVVEAEREVVRASGRFRTALAEAVGADLADRHAAGVREDGLGEAAEDIETDVDF
jgi:hypothetical protein